MNGYLIKAPPEAVRPTSEEEELAIVEVDDILKRTQKKERCQITSFTKVKVAILFYLVENEKNFSQIVGVCEVCDQNGDIVSKNDKSCHICIKQLIRFFDIK